MFKVKLTDSGQRYIFLLETVKQHSEKMPAVCLKKEEEVVVCMSCPAPRFLKVSTVGCSLSLIIRPVRAMDSSLFLIELSCIHLLATVMK